MFCYISVLFSLFLEISQNRLVGLLSEVLRKKEIQIDKYVQYRAIYYFATVSYNIALFHSLPSLLPCLYLVIVCYQWLFF